MRLVFAFPLLAVLIGVSACGGAVAPPTRAPSSQERESGAELFARGRDAAERGDSVRAEQYLLLAVERGYDRKRVLPILLQVCLSSSRLRAALNHAEPYLREHPENDELRYLVANIHLGLGQERAARLELEQLLRRHPESADAHYLLGVLESELEIEAAREHFRRYLAVAPRGEQAAEVRSRLSELAVREEAARRLAMSSRGRREGEQGSIDSQPATSWQELPGRTAPAEDER